MRINIHHLAATAIGDEVHIIAEVIFTGILVVCRIVGWDSKGRSLVAMSAGYSSDAGWLFRVVD